MNILERVLRLHDGLEGIPHAFGGAMALAWCTADPRGTSDIDLNVFVATDAADRTLDALPDGVAVARKHRTQLRRDGQTRVMWEETPVDLFLNTTEFHERAALRVVTRPFEGRPLPFLACSDLAVFKAFFDRSKDWVDLEEMAAAGRLDVAEVVAVLTEYLGGDDPRVAKVLALRHQG
jgi:hypothetical protein